MVSDIGLYYNTGNTKNANLHVESEQSAGRPRHERTLLQIPPVALSQVDSGVPVASGFLFPVENGARPSQTWAEPSAAFLGRQQVTAEEIDA